MCVASLSVTEQRKTVIDFVEYYFEYGAAIMKKPDEDENKWRVILQPFRYKTNYKIGQQQSDVSVFSEWTLSRHICTH